MMFRALAFSATLLATFLAADFAVRAQESPEGELPEPFDELIHSDLPIYNFEWEELYPRNFYSDESFGCASRVGFGDWQFTPSVANTYGSPGWLRFSNYGVFHCTANILEAYEREFLERGEFSRGFFALIGSTEMDGHEVDLWVLQQGFRTGSDYRLFAHVPDGEIIDSFTVLQRRCPEGRTRKLEGFDTWLTGYCSINTHEELLALAIEMANLPSLGTLQLQEESDTSVPDSSNSESSD